MSFGILFQFFWSSALIWLAARWLVKASDEIAQNTGLGHLFVGSIFLAASTSSPELFVDIEATRKGIPDLAAGDLLGSSLVNLTIFCVLSLIFWRSAGFELSRQMRLSAWLAALLTAEVGLFISFHSDLSFRGFSLASLILAVTYIAGLRMIFEKPRGKGDGNPPGKKRSPRLLFKSVIEFFSGTILIFFASPFLVSSVENIADRTGLGNSFIGMSLLALATSLPELSSSITAIRKGLFQLVAGNIAGSNTMNMLIFVVMDGIWEKGSLWTHLSGKNVIAAAFVAMNMALLAVPGTSKSGRRLIGDRVKIWLILISSVSSYVVLYFWKD